MIDDNKINKKVLKKKISREDFIDNIASFFKESSFNKRKKRSFLLFKLNKTYTDKFDNVVYNKKIIKPFLGFINILFSEYGFEIISHKTSTNIENVKVNTVKYSIDFIDKINKYL